jgi:hypothetical protein
MGKIRWDRIRNEILRDGDGVQNLTELYEK